MVEPRAGILIRLSEEKDTELGTEEALERFEHACRQRAVYRDAEVTAVFKEGIVSAYSGRERKVFDEAMRALEAGDIDELIIPSVDRLVRRTKDAARVEDALEGARRQRRHAVIVTADGMEMSIDNPAGMLVFGVQAATARHESAVIAKRVRSQNDQAARKGRPHGGGWRAFGFKDDGSVDRAEARLLRQAAKRLLDGESMGALLRDWRLKGITTPRGGPWSATPLRRALTSARVTGLRQHRGEVLEGVTLKDAKGRDVQPIISRSDWERLRSLFGGRRGRPGPTRKYLLSGIAHCGMPDCGKPLQVHSDGDGYIRYACHTAASTHGCGKVSVSQPRLDEYVTAKVLAWLAGPGLRRARRQLARQNEELIDLGEQLRADELELEHLARLKGEGRFGINEWLALRDPIEARIAAARARMEKIPDLAPLADIPVGEELVRAWQRWSLKDGQGVEKGISRKRSIMRSVIADLVIMPGRPGYRFDSGRVVLTFIDRQSTGGTRTAIVPVELPDDPELAGIREKIEREGPPQHETDEGVLRQIAGAMEEPTTP